MKLVAGLVLLLALACSAKPKQKRPAATPPPATLPSFQLLRQFGPHAAFFSVNDANDLLICDDCYAPYGDPRRRQLNRPLFLFDGRELREQAPLRDADVEHAIGQRKLAPLLASGEANFAFAGTYPQPLFLMLRGEYDNGHIDKASLSFMLSHASGAWKLAQWNDHQRLFWPEEHNTTVHTAPRTYDAALAELEETRGIVLAGGAGPLLFLSEKTLRRWDGNSWQKQAAEWEYIPRARRLSDGRSLVDSSRGLFEIDAHGIAIEPLRPAAEDQPLRGRVTLHFVRGIPFVTRESSLFAPRDPNALVVTLPPRPPQKLRSDLALGPVGVPPPRDFYAGCASPFVTLWRLWPGSYDRDTSYRSVAYDLADVAPLQHDLQFVELLRGDALYLGAQARDELTARALVSIVRRPGVHLGCWDMLSYLPDRYEPKWDAQRLQLNLKAGELL